MHKGSCLCGAVTFQLSGALAPPSVCHCRMCRKMSGHAWASTHVPQSALELSGQDSLIWYRASVNARRGFCGVCGSFLFWQHEEEDRISIAMGAFDTPTGAKLARHIFVDDKGDYYDLEDGLPRQG